MKLIVMLMLIAVSASARLDESKEECIKRYGEPRLKQGNVCIFFYKGYEISTIFIKNNCEAISYKKGLSKVGDGPLCHPKMSDIEIKFVLKVNSPKGWNVETLKNIISDHTISVWSSTEKGYFAALQTEDFINYSLMIYTKVYDKYCKDETKKENDETRRNLRGL